MTGARLHTHSRGAARVLLAALTLASGFDPSRVLAAQSLELELATLNGNAFVKISDFPDRAVLINVWGTECPPCIEETPLLNAQSRIYPNMQFVGIGTDDRISSLRFAGRFHVGYPELQAPKDPGGLLRRLGDLDGALPFTVVLDVRHRICAQRMGEVDAQWIAAAAQKCAGPPVKIIS